jgi:membrane-bound serine protease (ClpP class)
VARSTDRERRIRDARQAAMRMHRLLAVLALAFVCTPAGAAAPGPVVALNVTGVIGPASAEYIQRGLARAAKDGAQAVVLTLDTPGGLDTSMRRIVQDVLASHVPVVTYVAPSGARAASAGTFILYASHVAAMAPGTNVGAASPVAIGFTPPATPTDASGKKAATPDTHERKAMQDAAAYIRSLAQLRGRNAEWAEKAVTEAASLSASEAKEQRVIDLVAVDAKDLLAHLDGRTITTAGGERVLHVAGAATVAFEPDWHFRVLAIITDPSVAMILMLLGVYGLIFELGNPGLVFPGVMGAVSLLLGLYALHLLPVNYAGLALMALGIAFMIAEVFVPAYGSLGIGGIVAFVVGALMLIDTDIPGFGVPWTLIGALAILTAAFVVVVVRMAVRARRRPIVSGVESLVGADGEMLDDATDTGWANIRGETWQVRTAARVARGPKVRVVAGDGERLRVAPAADA